MSPPKTSVDDQTRACRRCGVAQPAAHGAPLSQVRAPRAACSFWIRWPSFRYRIDTIGVEGDPILDLGDGGKGSLIGPHGVDRFLSTERNAVVAAISLVRAVGGVLCGLEQRDVNIA